MLKRISLLVMIVALGLAVGFADQSKKKVVISVNKTDPTNGQQMYSSYCAPCHGADGKGHGPVAPALRSEPTNLTTLARANKGKFPDLHVASILRFGSNIPAHGSAAMPVWGGVLGKMNPSNAIDTDLRIANLTHYLEGLQEK